MGNSFADQTAKKPTLIISSKVTVAGWRTSRLHSVAVPDQNGAPEVQQRTEPLKSGIQASRFPETYPEKGGERRARRRAKPPEPGTRISGFPRVSKVKKVCARGAQKGKRMLNGKQRRVRTKKTAGKTREPPTHTLGKKDHLMPETTPRRDRTVPRSSNSATSLKGRG
ncbi:hypothetical protein NDU88_001954 [Pleurodeles waltl]|uniref:Uncharacterized protein n=1 Tax=Pleurodeles waltl TaxID=8319 RepID=A0AAV7SAG7_PLEWA|nr:hypothetical protein NDU88_001954 [Pleurodeles waltl]